MPKEYTHIKQLLNPNFMGEWSIPDGQDVVLTIGGFDEKEGYDKEANAKVMFPTIIWADEYEWAKPLIPNATNVDALRVATGTAKPSEMIGRMVQVGLQEGKWFGKVQKAVRIRPVLSSKLEAQYTDFISAIPTCQSRTDMTALMSANAIFKPYSKAIQKQIKELWAVLPKETSQTSAEPETK